MILFRSQVQLWLKLIYPELSSSLSQFIWISVPCNYKSPNTHTLTCTHTCAYTHMHTFTCTHSCVHIFTCRHEHPLTWAHTRMHRHTKSTHSCTHSRTHTITCTGSSHRLSGSQSTLRLLASVPPCSALCFTSYLWRDPRGDGGERKSAGT